jgi:hypothetical protein
LAACLVVPLLAVAQSDTDYAARARKAVEDQLRKSGKAPEDYRIEVVGNPNVIAGHSRLHRPGIAPKPGRTNLSGRVVNEQWEVEANARVTLFTEADPRVSFSAVTSDTGEFQLSDVVPGEYLLRSSEIAGRRIKVVPGQMRVILAAGRSTLYPLFMPEDARPLSAYVNSYRQEKLEMIHRVEFRGTRTTAGSIDVDKDSAADELGTISLPTSTELKELRKQLEPILAAFLDVKNGLDRSKPILSSKIVCRVYSSGERLIPAIDEQRCALNLIDSIALDLWFQVEGIDDNAGPLLYDWYKEGPEGTTQEQLMEVARRRHEVLHRELREAGMFEPEHTASMKQYLRGGLAGAPIVKLKVSKSIKEFPLPIGELYMSPLGFFLIREGDELRIIGVLLAGG